MRPIFDFFAPSNPEEPRTERLVHAIAAPRAQALVDGGAFDGGIVPKLLAAAAAARSGIGAQIGVTAVTA